MAKKSQIFKSFADFATDMIQQTAKQADITKTKRPRIIKTPQIEVQKVEYVPHKKFTSDEIRIHNAWNKYKTAEPYRSMPEDLAYAEFIKDWDFRHDPSRIAIRDLGQTINQMDKTSGVTTPGWMRHAMTTAVSQNPKALMSFPPPAPKFGSISRKILPEVTDTKLYFPGQSYRGINNIDTMFENATSMSALGADDAASQFLSAGLSDVAAMARGITPTSFKYKTGVGIVPKPVLEEIAMRRNAPAGTAEWLQQINAKNPTLNTSYLDLFAKWPDHFKKMFNLDGTPIK